MLRFENYFCCLLNCYFIFCSFVLLSKNKKIIYLISAQIVFFLLNGVSFLLIGNFLLCFPFFFLIDKSDFQVSFLLFFFNLFHCREDLR